MSETEPPDDGAAAGRPPAARVRRETLPRALVVLLVAASVVIVAAGAWSAAWLVGPLFLALVIVITVHPVHERLVRIGLPRWVASGVVLVCVYGLLLVLVGVIVLAVAQLTTTLPGYAGQANTLLNTVLGWLAELGAGPDQLRTVGATLDTNRLLGLASGLVLSVWGWLGTLVLLLSLLLFLTLEAADVRIRQAVLAKDHPAVAEALTRFTRGTRRYMAVNSVFGLAIGAINAIVLAALGVPLALLWGLLAFITNYIPYVGLWIGLAPPAILALLVGGWQLAVTVIGICVVINFVLTMIVQPRFVGDAMGLSTTIVLVGLVFWGWLLGPLGAVLAAPLTLLVKILLVDVDPSARWMDAVLGATPRNPASGADEDPAASPSPP